MTANILIVEDDIDLRECLRELLAQEGYLVRTAADGPTALTLIQKTEPDLILLDLGLPSMSGDIVLKEVKRDYPDITVIMLTARDKTTDVVSGLSLGADDYITKPFEFDELVARVKARLRKFHADETVLSVGDLRLNTRTYEVTRNKKTISLTPQEFKILEYLMANKGRVLSREMIISRLWRGNPDIETRVVDVYIGYLRKKIDSGQKKKLIQSVRGFGYKIDE